MNAIQGFPLGARVRVNSWWPGKVPLSIVGLKGVVVKHNRTTVGVELERGGGYGGHTRNILPSCLVLDTPRLTIDDFCKPSAPVEPEQESGIILDDDRLPGDVIALTLNDLVMEGHVSLNAAREYIGECEWSQPVRDLALSRLNWLQEGDPDDPKYHDEGYLGGVYRRA